jgi:hypothetical protein
LPSPPNIWVGGRLSIGGTAGRSSANPGTGVSPWSDAANCLLGVPFQLEAARTTFYKGWWLNGSSAGTTAAEVGIWDEAYNKITTTGSVVGSGNDIPQSSALATTVTLGPGRYYMGMAANQTTTNRWSRFSVATVGVALWQGLGCWKQAAITLGSLAATATPADITNVALPAFGLLTRTVFDL